VAWAASLSLGCEPSGVVVAERNGQHDIPSRGPRARLVVRDAKIFTDRDTRLRGVTIGSDSGLDFGIEHAPEGTRLIVRSFLDELALESGVNFVHVYLENQTTELGSGLAFGDLLVEETERAGLYLLVALGSGTELGSFDPVQAEAFWNLYSPRYAERTHVFYEIHNAPERTCDAPWAPESIGLENDLFDLVRSHAPETHVVTFSYFGTPTNETLLSGITEATSIDWTNASVGFHATDACRPIADLAALPPTPPDQPVALLATELPQDVDTWQPATTALETGEIGWANFRWLKFSSDMGAFRAEHDAIGAAWCPDFGTWPMDSSACDP
jgi:hypothetical protein